MTVMQPDPRRDVAADLVRAETRDLDIAARERRVDDRDAVAELDEQDER